MTYELGYRVEPLDNVSLDLATFYNDGTSLRGADYASQNLVPTPVPHIVQNVIMGNFASARTYGWELAGEWQPTQGWRLRGTYAYWNGNAVQNGFNRATTNLGVLGQAPHNQFCGLPRTCPATLNWTSPSVMSVHSPTRPSELMRRLMQDLAGGQSSGSICPWWGRT